MMELISTGQAAEIVDVHESTIKRWCDAGELECSFTEGGHRRIALDDLLEFARANTFECPLLVFASWAEDVWKAVNRVRHDGDPTLLTELTYEWLETPWTGLPGQALVYCLEKGVPLTTLFDDILRPVLYRVGDDWGEGCLQIGDEHRMTFMLRDALVPVRRLAGGRAPHSVEARVAVIGCAGGTEHEMGAAMVRILLEARGWEVVYLGGRVPVEDFVLQQQKFGASLVGISVSPPLISSDARRIVRVLSGLYDKGQPFHLAIGGSVVRDQTGEDVFPHPFESCRFYGDTAGFDVWLDAIEKGSLAPSG